MKRTFLLSLLLACVILGACTSKRQETASTSEAETHDGAWQAGEFVTDVLTDKQRTLFEKATETLTGASYEPSALLATQVVSGTNYAFLAQSTPSTEQGANDVRWSIVVIYEDLKGNVEITSMKDIDLEKVITKEASSKENMTGAYSVNQDFVEAETLPDDAWDAFNNATAEYEGLGFTPIALLGSQVVSGMNYKVLCLGMTATENPEVDLYVVDVYENPDGEASITTVTVFDLLSYIE